MGYFSLQKQVEGASSGSHWRRDTKRGVKDCDHTVFKVFASKGEAQVGMRLYTSSHKDSAPHTKHECYRITFLASVFYKSLQLVLFQLIVC